MAVRLNRVVIIGAGIGGLSAAIALRRIGLEVQVYEKAPAFQLYGAGLTLWSNAIKGLRKLGVTEEALGGLRINRAEILDWRGRVIKRTDVSRLTAELGAPAIAVHRIDLHQALLAQLPPKTVRTCMEPVSITEYPGSVVATFQDESCEECDLLIGADGIHSFVRSQLFPEAQLRYSGYAAWRGVAHLPDSALTERTSESWGRGQRFGIVPLGRNRVYWFATANVPAGRRLNPNERREELQRRFHGWHATVVSLIGVTPLEVLHYHDIYDLVPQPSWTRQSITLLGDAAHATTPNMGQGACQAIESSIVLARCLEEENDLPAALRRYERERMPRTAWITNQSWQIGRAGQAQNGLVCAARNLIFRGLPDSFLEAQLRKAAGYEV